MMRQAKMKVAVSMKKIWRGGRERQTIRMNKINNKRLASLVRPACLQIFKFKTHIPKKLKDSFRYAFHWEKHYRKHMRRAKLKYHLEETYVQTQQYPRNIERLLRNYNRGV